jgi:non-heme chloroperoxidase
MKIPSRGHALTIDHGWQEVADITLAFVQKYAKS